MSWDIHLYAQVQGAKMAQAQTNLFYILETVDGEGASAVTQSPFEASKTANRWR
jgi:hypothetical protein